MNIALLINEYQVFISQFGILNLSAGKMRAILVCVRLNFFLYSLTEQF